VDVEDVTNRDEEGVEEKNPGLLHSSSSCRVAQWSSMLTISTPRRHRRVLNIAEGCVRNSWVIEAYSWLKKAEIPFYLSGTVTTTRAGL